MMSSKRSWVVMVAMTAGAAFGVGDSRAQIPGDGQADNPQRLRRSIDGPVTREAVSRSFRSLVPVDAPDAADENGPTEVSVMLRIEFAFDSAELTPAALRDLEQVAAGLIDAEMADVPITLEGHTDSSGEPAYNRRLSRQRAEAVQQDLIRHGVASDRLRAVGHGADRPLDDMPPTDGRQRRVELVFTF